MDAGLNDVGARDAGSQDAGRLDGAHADAPPDGGALDAGADAGPPCGAVGESCCPGERCDAFNACVDGLCEPCDANVCTEERVLDGYVCRDNRSYHCTLRWDGICPRHTWTGCRDRGCDSGTGTCGGCPITECYGERGWTCVRDGDEIRANDCALVDGCGQAVETVICKQTCVSLHGCCGGKGEPCCDLGFDCGSGLSCVDGTCV